MSDNKLATKEDLKEMYNRIYPYLGGLVTSKAGFTPIGTIISVMGTTAPVNYLACDGTVYNIADYVELANYFNEQFGSKNFFGGNGTTTFAVPDLRGEFLRGTGTNSHSGQGSGASVGVHQDGTSVFGMYKDANTFQVCANNSSFVGGASEVDAVTTTSTEWIIFNKSTIGGSEARSGKVRPTNTSVLYCIATKNFYIDPTLDYSTDEKIIGTWIDGKPVYQKTYTFARVSVSNLTWVNIVQDATINVDRLIDVVCGNKINTSGYETGIIKPNNSVYDKQTNYFKVYISGTSYYIDTLTAMYTKTTD